MLTIRGIAVTALLLGSTWAPHAAPGQGQGVRRSDLQKHDLSIHGREVIQVRVDLAPGAAFGMHVGPASRWVFAALSMTIVVVLLRVTAELTRSSALAALGVPIVIGGALGNLFDRIRYREGVVDFIDIGVGDVRFWTFNVADIAVTIGAACLIVALWRQDRDERREGHNDELSVPQ